MQFSQGDEMFNLRKIKQISYIYLILFLGKIGNIYKEKVTNMTI